MFRVRIKIPSNFRSFRTGFGCPNCKHEINKTLKGGNVCHKTRCPSCSEDIMVQVYNHARKEQ